MIKHTRANVEKIAKDKGHEPVQIDGIPEGFSFKEADVNIGGKDIKGSYIAYIPNSDKIAHGAHPAVLLDVYRALNKDGN